MIIVKKVFILFSLLCFLSIPDAFSASTADYLKQLELEANDEVDELPVILNSTEPQSTAGIGAPSNDTVLIQGEKELVNNLHSFEKVMKVTYPESYNLYEQLTVEQKNSIYDDFVIHERLYNSSVKIISSYLSSH